MNTRHYFSGIYLVLLLVILPVGVVQSAVSSSDDLRRSPVVKAVEKVSPAVVNISTEKIVRERVNPFYDFGMDPFFDQFFSDFFESYPQREREYKKESLGSGVIIDKRGYILTNEHVILKASKITVILADGREFEGKLMGSDPKSDIAVVSIEVKGELPVVTMGNSADLMIGEPVIAIGNPFGLSHTVTTGVISALDRSIKAGGNRVYNDFIQTDASINPGNSGGPLLNIKGELIGINSAIYQKAQGIGFAIPIDKAKRIMNELIQFGTVHSAWLGIFVQELTPALIQHFGLTKKEGVLVSQVVKNSPGAKAQIRHGDIILQVDGKKVKSIEDYKARIAGFTAHDQIKLRVLKDGQPRDVTLVADELPLEAAQEVAYNWLGIKVVDITIGKAAMYKLYTRKGVMVTEVREGSAAYGIGIQPTDVIRQINNQNIDNVKDFRQAILSAYPKDRVLFLIQRGDYGYYVTLEP
jgi:serine protease Do